MSDLNVSVISGKLKGHASWEGNNARFQIANDVFIGGKQRAVLHNVVLNCGERTKDTSLKFIRDNLVNDASVTIHGTDLGDFKAITTSGLVSCWKPKNQQSDNNAYRPQEQQYAQPQQHTQPQQYAQRPSSDEIPF